MMNKNLTEEYKDFILLHGDNLEQINQINHKVDMIFANPPYFLSKGCSLQINGIWKNFEKGEWNGERDFEAIKAFNYKWLSAYRKVLKDDGTIWVCGTYHNILSVASCMVELGYKILNVIVWQKSDARPTLSRNYFNFTTEYIVWARKHKHIPHYFNCNLMEMLNGGTRMSDVWKIPFVASWEMQCGAHPTQKPLRLLYRIILSSTREGDTILDPFAGSCTTGITANLLNRKFIGIEQNKDFLKLGIRRKEEINSPLTADKFLKKMAENPEEIMVMINHARKELKQKMIEKGICYLRAGDSKGSLLVTPGFERMQYVLLHTNGKDCQLFKLKNRGTFQIWTADTLRQYGFSPTHAPYYVVLFFNSKNPIKIIHQPNLKEGSFTYKAKIRPLSDFIGIK
jgi:site-specific DNA-methyltransferase (adenine-specific)